MVPDYLLEWASITTNVGKSTITMKKSGTVNIKIGSSINSDVKFYFNGSLERTISTSNDKPTDLCC